MSTLLIASNDKDYNYLKENGFIEVILKAFNADEHIWCDSIDCIKSLSQSVDYILHFNSFPISYSRISKYAAASMTVDKVIGVSIEPDTVWIYDKGLIANKTTHNNLIESLVDTINNSNKEHKIANCLLGLIFVLILIAILLMNFNKPTYDTTPSDVNTIKTSQIEAIE